MYKIGIVISSTRPSRICGEIAHWVYTSVENTNGLNFELIDLASINLPFLDEPEQPAYGNYQHAHTKAWSKLVSSFDGFIFVQPQYNWGYPAPLKNALDFLYQEWAGKPASIISYGSHGGGKATAQLQEVLLGLHMRNTATNPQLSLSKEMLGTNGHFKNITTDLLSYKPLLMQAAVEIAELCQSPSTAHAN
jgi:NAD(P)H-dependent FMN reductase